jgi:hypothetical protein
MRPVYENPRQDATDSGGDVIAVRRKNWQSILPIGRVVFQHAVLVRERIQHRSTISRLAIKRHLDEHCFCTKAAGSSKKNSNQQKKGLRNPTKKKACNINLSYKGSFATILKPSDGERRCRYVTPAKASGQEADDKAELIVC